MVYNQGGVWGHSTADPTPSGKNHNYIINSFAQQGTAEIETKLKECLISENTLKIHSGQKFQHYSHQQRVEQNLVPVAALSIVQMG